MIEIIKHGKLKKGTAKCLNCGCEFSFEERDLEQTWDSNKGVLTCPECERTVKNWEWVEENHVETRSITELVDLEKEIDKYCESIEAWQIQEAPFTSIENCAIHFYELGKKGNKELNKKPKNSNDSDMGSPWRNHIIEEL